MIEATVHTSVSIEGCEEPIFYVQKKVKLAGVPSQGFDFDLTDEHDRRRSNLPICQVTFIDNGEIEVYLTDIKKSLVSSVFECEKHFRRCGCDIEKGEEYDELKRTLSHAKS